MTHPSFSVPDSDIPPEKIKAHHGQGGLIAIAVTMLIAFVIAGSALSGITQMNAKRTVVTKQSLQTYYTAQAGLQEALATRMLPRSNYLNFAGFGSPRTPYYTRSGLVYQDPVNRTGLVGVYRYVILGGDSARRANGSYYPDNNLNPYNSVPRLITTDSIPQDSPFIVVSNALTCKTSGGGVAVDQINVGITPSCRAGTTADQLTLVAQARLMQEAPIGSPVKDRVDQMRVFKNPNAIQLPAGAFIDGQGWENSGTTVSFNSLWQIAASASDTDKATKPARIVFYNFLDNTIYDESAINATNTNIGNVPAKSVIRVYFNGPIDYRSISPTFNRNLDDCKTTPSSCRIRIRNLNTNAVYGGNSIIPLFPGSNQVILLPPLTNTIAGGGTPYELTIESNRMTGFNGGGSTNSAYTIRFNSI